MPLGFHSGRLVGGHPRIARPASGSDAYGAGDRDILAMVRSWASAQDDCSWRMRFGQDAGARPVGPVLRHGHYATGWRVGAIPG